MDLMDSESVTKDTLTESAGYLACLEKKMENRYLIIGVREMLSLRPAMWELDKLAASIGTDEKSLLAFIGGCDEKLSDSQIKELDKGIRSALDSWVCTVCSWLHGEH